MEVGSSTTPTLQQRGPGFDLRQLIKLAVYLLLIVNFALYFADDWEIASHTRRNGGSFLDWTSSFATSIDELAWFALLFLFELETYILSDKVLTGYRTVLVHGTRIVCYAFLAHTVYAYAVTVSDLHRAPLVENTRDLCQMVEAEVSYANNLDYTLLNAENCAALSQENAFYFIENTVVVTDAPGLVIELQLAWVDLVEAVVWLAILLAIEILLRLQDRGIVSGPLTSIFSRSKMLLYTLLWFAAGYWIYRGHLMFAWDEALWILGFAAIEMNMSDWKKEIIKDGTPER